MQQGTDQAKAASDDQEAALAAKWGQLLGLQLASELHEAMSGQQLACEAMLQTKDTVAGQLAETLSHKDDEFVAVLKMQASEQDMLLQYFKQQNDEMQEACATELRKVEAALQQVRGGVGPLCTRCSTANAS